MRDLSLHPSHHVHTSHHAHTSGSPHWQVGDYMVGEDEAINGAVDGLVDEDCHANEATAAPLR